jgi:hypothetical protein
MDKIGGIIIEIIKTILLMILWAWILYGLGCLVLWVFSLGKYPKNMSSNHKGNIISGVGVAFIVFIWLGIAGYNNFVNPVL